MVGVIPYLGFVVLWVVLLWFAFGRLVSGVV